MRKFAAFLVYLLAFAVIIAMGGLFLGYWVSNGERNLSYVYVGDVNVSGKTRDETEEILRSNGWGDRETTPLTVTTFRGEQFRVDPIRSGVAMHVESLVDSAYAVGHDGDMISNLITAVDVFMSPVDVNRTEREIDTNYIDGLIAEVPLDRHDTIPHYLKSSVVTPEAWKRVKEERFRLVPICPEQAGGLPTPRLPSERRGEQVVNRAGENVTEAFRRGAELALERALREGCRLALLKERSPSCGSGRIYDGSFTGTVIPGDGVTAEMLKKSGLTVCSETEFAY